MYGELLQHQPTLKYLGVWFDEHMTWQHHVCEAIRKARCGLASGLYIVALSWVGGSTLYFFFGWLGG